MENQDLHRWIYPWQRRFTYDGYSSYEGKYGYEAPLETSTSAFDGIATWGAGHREYDVFINLWEPDFGISFVYELYMVLKIYGIRPFITMVNTVDMVSSI